jgi:hypothetical protein
LIWVPAIAASAPCSASTTTALSPASITIDALGAGSTVLETYTFPVNLNDPLQYNVGLFYGFTRTSVDIVALRVTGDGFVVDNVSAVPVPAALPLLLSGLGMLGAAVRRRRNA